MKTSKLLLLWGLTFLAGAVVGGVCLHWLSPAPAQPQRVALEEAALPTLSLAQLESATLPEGMQEEQMPRAPQSSVDIPSQLVRSDLPEDVVSIGGAMQPATPSQTPAGIALSDEQDTLVLQSKQPVARASDATSATLIEAPVTVKRIQTLDQYKAFKTKARGSYPSADFAQEEVLVLESASNLPDNVFEIVDVLPEEETLLVLYRVNVLGLDKKTNTHSARKVAKTSRPVTLRQVL